MLKSFVTAVTLLVPLSALADCPDYLDHSMRKLHSQEAVNFCEDFSDKPLLIVNTASYCGYTAQYDGLEKLYAKYKDQGLAVLGFPSNDFSQEPGDNKEIADFCTNTYGVKFPMFAKTVVSGKDANPFYQQLAKMTGAKPMWNFHKYLISADGQSIESFVSLRKPMGGQIEKAIQRELGGMRSPQATK